MQVERPLFHCSMGWNISSSRTTHHHPKFPATASSNPQSAPQACIAHLTNLLPRGVNGGPQSLVRPVSCCVVLTSNLIHYFIPTIQPHGWHSFFGLVELNSVGLLANAAVRGKCHTLDLNVLRRTPRTWWIIIGSFTAPQVADSVPAVSNELWAWKSTEDAWHALHRVQFLAVVLTAPPLKDNPKSEEKMHGASPGWLSLDCVPITWHGCLEQNVWEISLSITETKVKLTEI